MEPKRQCQSEAPLLRLEGLRFYLSLFSSDLKGCDRLNQKLTEGMALILSPTCAIVHGKAVAERPLKHSQSPGSATPIPFKARNATTPRQPPGDLLNPTASLPPLCLILHTLNCSPWALD